MVHDTPVADQGTGRHHEEDFAVRTVPDVEVARDARSDVIAARDRLHGVTDGGAAATVHIPIALVTDLDLVIRGQGDVPRDEEQAFFLEDDVRTAAPAGDGTHHAPAGLVDDDGLGGRVIGDNVVAFLHSDVVTAGDGRERLADLHEDTAAVVVPAVVLADLELAADLGHGAHPLAVGEGHVHIAAPLVEVADEGPDLAVVNGDGEVVGVQDDLPEARADLDVVTTGDSLERTSELDEGTAVVLVPTGILTPLELRIASA
jgi:hypothetical protein